MAERFQKLLQSPIGPLTLTGTAEAVTALDFGDARGTEAVSCPLLELAAGELAEYFDGKRRSFDLPLAPDGTDFQKRVWAALLEIPYGTTASYGEIAAKIGRGKASRAVGQANHRNPLPVFIPCHRVVGAGGQLTGYRGGLEKKMLLLAIEGVR